jgi:hypothetical protein
MTITNSQSRTNVHEIAAGIFRISTPIPPSAFPGGFTFNQFLVVDDAPLLFHTGPRAMFPLVQGAVEHVLGDLNRLRYVGFSHIESDECGSMNAWLAAAPRAEAVGSRVAAMTSADLFDRPPRALADGEELALGKKRVRWLDAPHLPHNWECGYLFESAHAPPLRRPVHPWRGRPPAPDRVRRAGSRGGDATGRSGRRRHRSQYPRAAGEAGRHRTNDLGPDARQLLPR